MREQDFTGFSQMLDAVCSLLSRGAYIPSPTNTALFFRALAKHDIAAVRAGFDAHVADPQRGRFVPVPADVIAQIDGMAADDGRPGADEAWAVALRADDESATVVWTDEMAEAWGIARSVFAAGDEVGARVAFRDAYNRLVGIARRERKPTRWDASLGFDQSGRGEAIKVAIELGRLPAPAVPLLVGPTVSIETLSRSAPEHARRALERLRETLLQRAEEPSPDAAAKQHTAQLRAQAANLVVQYRSEVMQ